MQLNPNRPVPSPNADDYLTNLPPILIEGSPVTGMFAKHGTAARQMWCDALSDSMAGLTYAHPFFSSYLNRRATIFCLYPDDPMFKSIPTAATNGRKMWINAAFFSFIKATEAMGVLAHEICHDMLDHPRRGRLWHDWGYVPSDDGMTMTPYDPETANVAMDAEINPSLKLSKFELPKPNISLPWVKPGELTVETIYEKVYQSTPPKQGGSGQGQGQGGKGSPQPGQGNSQQPGPGDDAPSGMMPSHGGFDQHVLPDDVPSDVDNEDRKSALVEAVAAGKRAGNMPAHLERLVEDLTKPLVDWTRVLQDLIVKTIGQDSIDWWKFDKRDYLLRGVIEPARTSHRCGHIALLVDVSGSTSAYIQQFLGEAGGICEELQPKGLHVIWCDTRVAGVDSIEDARASDVAKLTIQGGGGTDLRPGFEWLAEHLTDFGEEVAALVVLTDSETPWPNREPEYPVIIATTAPDHSSNPSWATVVGIDEEQARQARARR